MDHLRKFPLSVHYLDKIPTVTQKEIEKKKNGNFFFFFFCYVLFCPAPFSPTVLIWRHFLNLLIVWAHSQYFEKPLPVLGRHILHKHTLPSC